METIKDICAQIYIFFKNLISALLPKNRYEKEPLNDKEEILIDFEKNEILKEKNHIYTIEDFIKIKTLGKGSFGKVLLVKNKYTNEHYAMKILNQEFLKKRKANKSHKNRKRNIRKNKSSIHNKIKICISNKK